MPPECQLIIEPRPLDGETNMARDAAMLTAAVENGECCLRFYTWSQPTLSLGYFQKPETIPDQFSSLPCVKRLSGGGAILHDQELTYSCAVPPGHHLAARPTHLYGLVHDKIVAVVEKYGLPIRLRGTLDADRAQKEPFLCFLRKDSHDLVIGSHKVLGSAQRRRKGAILQHGSLLVRHSENAPQILGLRDCGDGPECSVLSAELSNQLGPLFGTVVQIHCGND